MNVGSVLVDISARSVVSMPMKTRGSFTVKSVDCVGEREREGGREGEGEGEGESDLKWLYNIGSEGEKTSSTATLVATASVYR